MVLGWLVVAEQQKVNEEELNRPPLPSIENASKPNDHIDIWPQSTCRHSSGPSFYRVRADGDPDLLAHWKKSKSESPPVHCAGVRSAQPICLGLNLPGKCCPFGTA